MQPIGQSTGHPAPSVLPPPLPRVPGLRAPRLAAIADIQHGLIEQVAVRSLLPIVDWGLLWWPHDLRPSILPHRITGAGFLHGRVRANYLWFSPYTEEAGPMSQRRLPPSREATSFHRRTTDVG